MSICWTALVFTNVWPDNSSGGAFLKLWQRASCPPICLALSLNSLKTLKPLHRRDEKKTTPEIVMEDAFFKYSTADWHSSWCRLRWVYKTCLIFFHFKPRIYRLPSQARLHANRDADVESQWGVCSSVLHNKLHTTTHTQTHTHPPAELFREDSTQAMHDHICLKQAFIQALFFFYG